MMMRRPVEAIGAQYPAEAMARALVVGLLPVLEAAMARGLTYRQTMADARALYPAEWRKAHGAAVAARAAEILEAVGPAAILTPYGREVFLREYPLGAMPAPPVANEKRPTPREGIGRRLRQAWVSFWRIPPASSA